MVTLKDWSNQQQENAEKLIKYAVLAYDDRKAIENAIGNEIQWFEAVGGFLYDTQAFAYKEGRDLYVAFRGTQEIRDFVSDLKVVKSDLMSFDGKRSNSFGFETRASTKWL